MWTTPPSWNLLDRELAIEHIAGDGTQAAGAAVPTAWGAAARRSSGPLPQQGAALISEFGVAIFSVHCDCRTQCIRQLGAQGWGRSITGPQAATGRTSGVCAVEAPRRQPPQRHSPHRRVPHGRGLAGAGAGRGKHVVLTFPELLLLVSHPPVPAEQLSVVPECRPHIGLAEPGG